MDMEPSQVSPQEAHKQLLNAKERLSRLDSDANPDLVSFWQSRVRALESVVVSQIQPEILERWWPKPKSGTAAYSVYCLCGCGTRNKPRSHFVRGHAKRLIRRLEDIERGIGTMADLPFIVRNVLLDPGQPYFKICVRCGNPFLGGGRDCLGPICSRL